MTLTDWELWACANKLIADHGDAAGLEAATKADALLLDGDREGVKAWTAILRRIEQLQAGGTVQ